VLLLLRYCYLAREGKHVNAPRDALASDSPEMPIFQE
jgi:hypothetical protein